MAASALDITPAKRNVIFATLVSTCVILSLQSTALNTALPPIIADLGISLSLGQWVTSGYTLVLAVMMPLTAFFSTRFSTRPLYIATLVSFVAGSLLCAVAPSFEVLMAGRVIQATANALVANVTQVSIMRLFPEDQRGQAMGWFGLAIGAAPIAAPALGGFVVDAFGWRMAFWAICALSLVSLVGAVLTMENTLETRKVPFDSASFVLSVLAFGGLSLGLGNVASLGISSPLVVLPLVVGVVAAVFFSRRQLASDQPFLKLRILGTGRFARAVVASMLLYGVMMGAAAVLPLHIQGVLGQSATVSGLVVLPGAACTALISPVAGRLFDRMGMRALLLAGAGIMVVSNAFVCVPTLAASLPALCALNALRCFAVGMLTMTLMTWGNSVVSQADMPHASALLTSLRNLAGALGVAAFVGVFDAFGLVVCFVALAAAGALIALCALGDNSQRL